MAAEAKVDWMVTPDGRRGWATILLEQGYKIYVVDARDTAGRLIIPIFTGAGPARRRLNRFPGCLRRNERMRPGRADSATERKAAQSVAGDRRGRLTRAVQLVASQGGSYGNGLGLIKDSRVVSGRRTAAKLLEKIGPAIIMTHSAGGPFGFYGSKPAEAGEGDRRGRGRGGPAFRAEPAGA